jgi:hypothetical protein
VINKKYFLNSVKFTDVLYSPFENIAIWILLFFESLQFDLSRIPPEIIASISKDFEDSYHYARKLQFDLSRIPKEIMNSIKE